MSKFDVYEVQDVTYTGVDEFANEMYQVTLLGMTGETRGRKRTILTMTADQAHAISGMVMEDQTKREEAK